MVKPWSSIHIADRQLANTIFAPIDRSMPPEMTITLWAIARKASDIVPAVIVRMAKPSTSGSCEKRQSISTTSSTATPNVQPWRRASRDERLDGSGSVVTAPSNVRDAHRVPAIPTGVATLDDRGAVASWPGDALTVTPPTPRRQAVGGGQQRVLAGVGGQLGDDAAAVQDGGAVADQADLAQLAGEHEDRRALVGERADEVVHLVLGADVDAPRRVEQQHHAQPAGEPAGDRHLLLVAAGQPAHLAGRAGVDRQAARPPRRRGRAPAPAVDRAPLGRRG